MRGPRVITNQEDEHLEMEVWSPPKIRGRLRIALRCESLYACVCFGFKRARDIGLSSFFQLLWSSS